MKVKAYRLEKERLDGSFCGCQHYDSLEEAERFGLIHQRLEEYNNNSLPSQVKRLFTIWETTVIA